MDINEFKKKNNPKKTSSLKEFEFEILELINSNYSQVSILVFLSYNGIKTTQQNLSKFIKTIQNQDKPTVQKKVDKVEIETDNPKPTKSFLMPKFEKKGKDLEMKDAPDWAK